MTIVGPDALGREGASVGRSLRGHAPDTEREEIPGFRFSVQASGMTRGLPRAGLKKGNGVGVWWGWGLKALRRIWWAFFCNYATQASELLKGRLHKLFFGGPDTSSRNFPGPVN